MSTDDDVAAQLDALNRRITYLSGRITHLSRLLDTVATAESIIRRAHFSPYLDTREQRRPQPRDRHLRSV